MLPDFTGLAYVIVMGLCAVCGLIAGCVLGAILMFFGWSFFKVAFIVTALGFVIGHFWGLRAERD